MSKGRYLYWIMCLRQPRRTYWICRRIVSTNSTIKYTTSTGQNTGMLNASKKLAKMDSTVACVALSQNCVSLAHAP